LAHAIEIWEMVGEKQTIYTAACLACGWIGEDEYTRSGAEADGRDHEAGIRPPWVIEPGRRPAGWEGDPRSRPHDRPAGG
jgi:hypothetical protein